jgi:Arc/MetJ-type ribon-helix-helix transcriptional regulator
MYYMRTIVNISLPKEMAEEIKLEVKKGHFASTSEFVRALIREYKRAKIAEELHKQTPKFEAGKGKILKSLKDLR